MSKNKLFLSLLALAFVPLSLTVGCKSNNQPANSQQSAATQPAPATAPSGAPAPAGAPSSAGAPASAPAAAPQPGGAPNYAETQNPPAGQAAPAAPPEPVEYTVPAGTRVSVRIGQTLSSKNSSVGESFSGTLVSAVTSHGVTVFRAGSPVSGTVTSAKGQGRFKGEGNIGVQLTSIGRTSVSSSEFLQVVKGKGKRTGAMVGGGAGGGALIGGLAGGGKGALIGGLLGAGAGTAGSAFTGNKEAVIPAETVVTFRLTNSVTVRR